jgi:YidC/Oxa1 family membrane protein insertase
MEKRTLLAFVLSLAVLLFWELYFGLYRTVEPPPQQETAPMSTSAPAPAAEPKVAPGITSESLPPQALPEGRLTSVEQNFKKWTVDSSLFDMDIAAPGARINSFRLEKFRTEVNPDSPPMELVPTQATGYFPLAVDLLHHPDWQLSTRSYTSPASARLSLPEEGQPQTLSFSTEIPGQVQLTKTFTFLPDKYDMDVEVRVKNLSDDKLTDQMGISFYYQPYGAAKEDSYNLSRLGLFAKGSLSTFDISALV